MKELYQKLTRQRELLDPIDRFSEILFGLIMVLTFTCSISAAESGHEEVRIVLFGAIGCNLAWGLVDGVMYLFTALADRGRGLVALRSIKEATDAKAAHDSIADALPPVVASLMGEAGKEAIRMGVNQLPELPARPWLTGHDYRAAIAVLLLVFCSTFPVVIPFFFMSNAIRAMRVSNAIAIVLLFIAGFRLGKYMGHRPWAMGLSMVLIGVALVAVTMALGG